MRAGGFATRAAPRRRSRASRTGCRGRCRPDAARCARPRWPAPSAAPSRRSAPRTSRTRPGSRARGPRASCGSGPRPAGPSGAGSARRAAWPRLPSAARLRRGRAAAARRRRRAAGRGRLHLAVAGVHDGLAGGRELAEPVADHVLRHEYGHEQLAVVHVQRAADHLGRDHRAPRPGADDLTAARLGEPLDLPLERRLDVRSLLNGARHYFCPRRRTMKTSVRRLLRVLWPLVG